MLLEIVRSIPNFGLGFGLRACHTSEHASTGVGRENTVAGNLMSGEIIRGRETFSSIAALLVTKVGLCMPELVFPAKSTMEAEDRL